MNHVANYSLSNKKIGLKRLVLLSIALICNSVTAAGTSWLLNNPLSNASHLRAVTQHNGLYISVGDRGNILTSPDAVTWTDQTSDTTENLKGIFSNGNSVFVVGDEGTILSSNDGILWFKKTSTTQVSLNAVSSNGSITLAVGDAGTILSSTDGETWTQQTPVVFTPLSAITWNGNSFFVVGKNGVVLSSNNGLTWNKANNFVDENDALVNISHWLRSVEWNGKQLIAVGDSGLILTSTDGVTWRSENLAGINSYNLTSTVSIKVNGLDRWIVSGILGTILISTDGGSWTKENTNISQSFYALGSNTDDSEIVAVGEDGLKMVSSDGTAWIDQSTNITSEITGLASGGGQHVAVGFDGLIISSQNHLQWSKQTSNTNVSLHDVTRSNTHFVAVGDAGTVIASTDAQTWNVQTLPTSADLRGIAFSGTTYAAVGDGGVILTSTDTINWSIIGAIGTSNNLKNIRWDTIHNIFIVVGDQGTILKSADDTGATWSIFTLPNSPSPAPTLTAVTNDANIIVAVGNDGLITTSTDAAIWSNSATGSTVNLNKIVYDGTQFIVVGDLGQILTSPDGLTWTHASSGTTLNLNAITKDNNTLLVMGQGGLLIDSQDGISWTNQIQGNHNNLNDIAFDDLTHRYVSVGAKGTILTSLDHVNWVAVTSNSSRELRGIVWDKSQYIVVGEAGEILTSPDGLVWTRQNSGSLDLLNDVASNENIANPIIVTVGSNKDGDVILRSNDLINWTNHSRSELGIRLNDITWNGSIFLAVGSQGTVLTSIDGINWTKNETPTRYPLWGVSWTGNRFFAVGQKSTILNSLDGISWTELQSEGSITLESILSNGKSLLAIGELGNAYTSYNGINWTQHQLITNKWIRNMVWDGSQFVAIGNRGTIISSSNDEPDLELSTTTTNIEHKEDNDFSINLTIKNNQTGTATKIELTADIPSSLLFVPQNSSTPCSVLQGTLLCQNIATLTQSQSKTITLGFKALLASTVKNSFSITASENEIDLSNNNVTVSYLINPLNFDEKPPGGGGLLNLWFLILGLLLHLRNQFYRS